MTSFPGPNNWCEGVECADVDHDGDLDVFFAEGDGFSSAGVQRQSILLINKLIEQGTAWVFADESVARLGVNVSNAKGVTTGDVDGDGWVDALYANAFFTKPPFLYLNQGAGNPGFFTMVSATHGLTTAFSSGGAQFGDIDDDGDLDLIVGDAYNSTPAAKPHLFFNDGTGHFTENAVALGAANKSGQMDVNWIDIDNDGDLDFFGDNKFTNAGGSQYLMLNDGTGHFTDVSTLVGVGSGGNYEAEVGDLDGDDDQDLFFVSLSGFSEGAVRNNLVGGSLTFTNQAALAGAVDDNEIALCDYDNDGDYDVMVGSLGGHEYLWRNDGSFSFNNQSAAVQSVADSSLDCTFADLNNDGAYDLLTAQGESGAFQNRFYRNTGAPDTLAPVVLSHTGPSTAPATGPVVVHARIRDQVLDDGVNYVTASGAYVITTTVPAAAMTINAGAFSPPSLNITAGTTLTWTNASGANQSVTSTSAPYTYDSGTIANGGTFAFTFVTPGTYNFNSGPGGFSGSVSVSGSASAAIATYSGGQIYRFRMNDTAGGAGVQLAYELRFRDWAGNVRVTDTRRVTLGNTGTNYCSGDGSLATACPCGNFGSAGNGCANSANAAGAHLSASGSTAPDSVVLQSSGELPTVLSIFLQGNASNAAGAVFGDGVRCVAGSLKRMYTHNAVGGTVSAPQGGDASITTRSAQLGDVILSGSTRFYQVYYRDPNLAFCSAPAGDSWNVSNGVSILW
ncbi:MAG: VCBS repeat-containing protein [Planctomycetes bacterium]|nr:VCBS repeat-containing protein [Planctomycetota bacterium]